MTGGVDARLADAAIEAVLVAATEPVPPRLLAELLELPVEDVERRCAALAARCEEEGRGFVVARVAGGWRLQTHPALHGYVERFVLDGNSSRLSAAALETLAVVAYKQPVTRGRIAAIRGVNVDGVLRLLVQRGYVRVVGHDPGPGQPALYGTTPQFLERMGLDSLSDLPPLEELVPDAETVGRLEELLRAPRAE
jgi:segregation and condensation protein B